MYLPRMNSVALLVLFVQFGSIFTQGDVNDDSLTLNFEDNIDGKFTSFSKSAIRLSRQSSMELTPSRTVSSSQYQRLIDSSKEQPYYTLKVHFKRGPVQDHVMTSIPMCLVLQAQFQYTVTLFLNENGYIIGVQASTGNSTCVPLESITQEKRNEYSYQVGLRLQTNEAGPQPEIQSFLEKLKRQQEAKLTSQESDNRPFFLKYWKYILPVAVVLIVQTVFTSDGGGQAEGAGGGGGGGQ